MDETKARWIKEGMPENVDAHKYFNTVLMYSSVGINTNLYPFFEEEVIEETDEYRIFRDRDGTIQKKIKHKSSVPHFVDFTLKEARNWDEYKRRLQPDPARIPENLDNNIAASETSGLPIAMWTVSLMGWIRNWMGIENMSYLMYDRRDVYADMVNTLADLACWAIDQVIPRMKTKPDMVILWEDICGRSGPLVSPNIFKECVSPGYIKIRNKLEEYGIHLLAIDSDGDVAALVPLWFEAGVNIQFPLEIGVWNADPMKYRRKYGRELRFIGGFNKLVLEKGSKAIDAEIERRISLMKDGGFVIMPDHFISPGVSLENYKYYLERIRRLRI